VLKLPHNYDSMLISFANDVPPTASVAGGKAPGLEAMDF
jgi:hypothetical protein